MELSLQKKKKKSKHNLKWKIKSKIFLILMQRGYFGTKFLEALIL